MNRVIKLLSVLFGSVIAGCANQPNLNPSAEFAPIQPIPKAEEVRVTGAIFDNGMGLLEVNEHIVWEI